MISTVGLLASQDIVYVYRLDSVSKAFDLMSKCLIRHLPVVDEQGVVVGMLSDRDIIRAIKKPLTMSWTSFPSDPEFNPEDIVQEFMSWPIGTIEESASVASATEIMLERKISALIVTRDEKVIGILTTEDLLRALVEDHKSSFTGIKETMMGAIYSSPVGGIIQSLSNAGI